MKREICYQVLQIRENNNNKLKNKEVFIGEAITIKKELRQVLLNKGIKLLMK